MAIITVTNLNDSGPGSLRDAIAAAAPGGDTINFAVTGTIFLSSGELVVNKTLQILGPGKNLLTVSGSNLSRVFNVGGDLTLDAITIQDGSGAFFGGGIFTVDRLTVSNCNIARNRATFGGGSANRLGTVTMFNCSIFDNVAYTGDGGGIFMFVGSLSIARSAVFNNRAQRGGGIALTVARLSMLNCTISGNSASEGGGIANLAGVQLVDASFSTIARNNATTRGGGIDATRTVVVKNATADNTAPLGPDCGGPGGTFGIGVSFATTTDCVGFTVVTSAALNLGPLALNLPGTTETHALLAGSVAIDAALDCTDRFGFPVTVDQRGVARAQGAACDTGAFERAAAPVYTAPADQSTLEGTPTIFNLGSFADNPGFGPWTITSTGATEVRRASSRWARPERFRHPTPTPTMACSP